MKKSGSALVLMIAVVALITVLAVSVVTISTSTTRTNIAFDILDKVRLAAESGIERGKSKITHDVVASSDINSALNTLQTTTIPLQFYNNTVSCTVSFTVARMENTALITIKSFAANSGNKYSKTLTYQQTVQLPESGDDGGSIVDYIEKYCLNSVGDIKNPKEDISILNGTTNITGGVYLQARDIYVNSNTLNINGNLAVITFKNANFTNGTGAINGPAYFHTGQDINQGYTMAFNGGATLIADKDININSTTSFNNSSLIGKNVNFNRVSSSLGKAYIEADKLDYRSSTLSAVSLETYGIKQTYAGVLSCSNITISPVSKAEDIEKINKVTLKDTMNGSGQPDRLIFEDKYPVAFKKISGGNITNNNLNNSFNIPSGELSKPVNNYYKILIIDGNCTINGSYVWANRAFNNYIIYCTGTLTITNINLTLNNSAIYAKYIDLNGATLNMTSIDRAGNPIPFTQSIKDIISAYFDQYLE